MTRPIRELIEDLEWIAENFGDGATVDGQLLVFDSGGDFQTIIIENTDDMKKLISWCIIKELVYWGYSDTAIAYKFCTTNIKAKKCNIDYDRFGDGFKWIRKVM